MINQSVVARKISIAENMDQCHGLKMLLKMRSTTSNAGCRRMQIKTAVIDRMIKSTHRNKIAKGRFIIVLNISGVIPEFYFHQSKLNELIITVFVFVVLFRHGYLLLLAGIVILEGFLLKSKLG